VAAHPLLYEVNLRCFLTQLSKALARPAGLADITDEELDRWRALGFTHIWLMGVWPCGEKTKAFSRTEPHLRLRYSELLPDWTTWDVGGSTYSIQSYTVDPLIGGEPALVQFRERLQARGLRLILDFVPNHIGLDHPWIKERPDLLITRKQSAPGFFAAHSAGRKLWIAHGRDPYFPPWMDTAQVDHRNQATRHALIHELHRIASLCDGVRCDMAMLVLNDIFAETWKNAPITNLPPRTEFWADAISSIRREHPEFLFLAESYWNREPQLQQLGFDYTYEKTFLDHVAGQDTANLQSHLHHRLDRMDRDVRFLENHDEPRIASRLAEPAQKAAALLWIAMPGMKLLHEGQMEGWQRHVPVHLCRRPSEPTSAAIKSYYEHLLTLARTTAAGHGAWRILDSLAAWTGNPSHQSLFIISWQQRAAAFELIVVNFAPHRSQCLVRLDKETVAHELWILQDRLGPEVHERNRNDMQRTGLFLELPAWGAQWFSVQAQ
jgi:glycosidase